MQPSQRIANALFLGIAVCAGGCVFDRDALYEADVETALPEDPPDGPTPELPPPDMRRDGGDSGPVESDGGDSGPIDPIDPPVNCAGAAAAVGDVDVAIGRDLELRDAWWRVDLGGPHRVTGVNVCYEGDDAPRLEVAYAAARGGALPVDPTNPALSTAAGDDPLAGLAAHGVDQVWVRTVGPTHPPLTEVRVWGQPQVNAISKRQVWSVFRGDGLVSTQQGETPLNPDLAIDERFDGRAQAEARDGSLWWQVDLQAAHQMQGVTLWGTEQPMNIRVDYLDDAQGLIASSEVVETTETATSVALAHVGVHYVRVHLIGSESAGTLSLREVEVWGTALRNAAFDEPAQQSSRRDPATSSPVALVNGNLLEGWRPSTTTAASTNPESDAWWRVDLAGPEKVVGVTVRRPHPQWSGLLENQPLTDLRVKLLDAEDNVLAEGEYRSQDGRVTTCALQGMGVHSVRVEHLAGAQELQPDQGLVLAEVQVWAAPTPIEDLPTGPVRLRNPAGSACISQPADNDEVSLQPCGRDDGDAIWMFDHHTGELRHVTRDLCIEVNPEIVDDSWGQITRRAQAAPCTGEGGLQKWTYYETTSDFRIRLSDQETICLDSYGGPGTLRVVTCKSQLGHQGWRLH